ncbi:MAG: RsmD family RNA methyltransferase [Chloroflexi bacterium]|nr:RsmD family RNA methyltransferase [Chloroflexota bacterium]
MRILGGEAKGLRMKAPATARPTSSRVKKAMFAILDGLLERGEGEEAWQGQTVLDLYAGSGALGIEALSRGAAWADLVDQDHRACRLIQENLERAGLADRGRVHCWPVRGRTIRRLGRSYDIIVADPPYVGSNTGVLLAELEVAGVLHDGTIIAVERSGRLAEAVPSEEFEVLAERRYGDTVVLIMRYRQPAQDLP